VNLKILIVSLIPTHPTSVGNRARILGLSNGLRMLGHEVHFAFAAMEEGDLDAMRAFFGAERLHIGEYHPPPALTSKAAMLWRRIRRRLGMASGHIYGVDDWYDPALDAFYKYLAVSTHFDVVIAEYAFLSRALACFGESTTKIVDTHDRFTNRHEMFLAAGQPAGWFSTSLEEELKGLRRAGIVIAIEDQEREFFAAHLPDRPVITVGHIAGETVPIADWSGRLESSILMVGANNQPNVAGLRYVMQEVLPMVQLRHPKVRVLLAGSVCDAAPDSPLLQKLGYIKDVANAYAKTWITLNPVQAGSGQSIKSVEALSHSIPLVTTATGARGLPDSDQTVFLKVPDDDASAMANALIRLLESAGERTALSRAAAAYIRRYNEGVLARLVSALSRPASELQT
jgi:glycosyltransferase involved in cell wall biosynthesis